MRQILAGSTDISLYINIVDSGDGTPETGVVAATGGLSIQYVRNRAAAANIGTLADLAAVDSAHADGGIKHVANGVYRVDVADAAFAAGVDTVEIIGTATGMVVLRETVQLVGYNPRTELTSAVLARIDQNISAGAANVSITYVASLLGTPLNGADVVLQRGDTLNWELTGLGSLTGYTSLWITVKPVGFDTPDAKSLFQIKKNASGSGDGLLYANGTAAGTAADGSITIDDASAGDITIALQESVTALFAPGEYRYDIQKLVSGAVTTVTKGTFTVAEDVTQALT